MSSPAVNQTYGAVAAEEQHSTEETTLLNGASSSGEVVEEKEGSAGIVGSVSNLANTILGTGMLAFPAALASIGLIPGILSCLFSGATAVFGLYLLSLCAAEVRPKRTSSFNAVSLLTFGPKATILFDAAIAIKCFGVSCSYLIIIKTLTPTALTTLFELIAPEGSTIPAVLQSGKFWVLVSFIGNVPLSFLKTLNALRFTSQIALLAIAYLLFIVLFCWIHPIKGMEPAGDIAWFRWSHGAIGYFPVQVFAYTCSQNLFPVYNELKDNTQKRINAVTFSSIGSATFIYQIIAIAGYLTFGSNVPGNIISAYPNSSLFIAIGRVGIVIMVLFSYPLQSHPCRNSLNKVVVGLMPQKDAEEEPLVTKSENKAEITKTRFNVLTSLILLGGLAVSLAVDDLGVVLSFVGSTGSTIISFILPGFFYFSLFRRREGTSSTMKYAALALGIYGVVFMIFCLGYNVVKLTSTTAELNGLMSSLGL